MMPTFPSPPLKFRTVGFPQYDFKASLSDGACRLSVPVKRVPRIPRSTKTFTQSFARVPHRTVAWHCVQDQPATFASRYTPAPQGFRGHLIAREYSQEFLAVVMAWLDGTGRNG